MSAHLVCPALCASRLVEAMQVTCTVSNGHDGRFAGFGMELAAGTLRDRAAAGLLTAAQLHAALVQVTAALQNAHQRGVAHLDVKSTNVLVRKTIM